jgi:hypothetical protein
MLFTPRRAHGQTAKPCADSRASIGRIWDEATGERSIGGPGQSLKEAEASDPDQSEADFHDEALSSRYYALAHRVEGLTEAIGLFRPRSSSAWTATYSNYTATDVGDF